MPLATPPAAELSAQEQKQIAGFLPIYTPTSHAALCVNASSHTPCCWAERTAAELAVRVRAWLASPRPSTAICWCPTYKVASDEMTK